MVVDQNEMIRRLDEILDIERDALLSGELDTLHSIVEEKEKLIESLNNSEAPDVDELRPVNNKARRNQDLLEQALHGIRTVSKRLAELREARKTFDTYNKSGQRKRIESEDAASVEKRA